MTTSSSTRSPTAATRRRKAARSTSRPRAGRRGGAGRSRPSSAAISRWIATSAGTASSAPTTLLVLGAASTTPHRRAVAEQRYDRGETDEFVTADDGRRGGADPAGRRGPRLQLPRRPRASSRARCADPAFAGFDRGGAEARALHDADGVRGGLGLSRSSSRPSRRMTIAEVIADAGPAPAARRRDREVPARDVLLQRRRGGAVRGRGARARALAARRPDLRPQAGDERARGHRRVRQALRGRAPGFSIINFANPDMVGHTGVIEAAVKAVETVDACLGRVLEASRARRRDHRHRRPRQLRPHAQRRRLAEHRALSEPRPVHRHRGRRRLDGEGILADVAPDRTRAARHRAAGRDDGALAARL